MNQKLNISIKNRIKTIEKKYIFGKNECECQLEMRSRKQKQKYQFLILKKFRNSRRENKKLKTEKSGFQEKKSETRKKSETKKSTSEVSTNLDITCKGFHP